MFISLTNRNTIRVEHDKKHVDFQIPMTFNKTQLLNAYDTDESAHVFQVINDFLAQCSEDRAHKVFRIYEKFAVAREKFLDTYNLQSSIREETYKDLVKELFVLVDYESLYDYVTANVEVCYPDKVFDDYTDAGNNPRDRTYIKPDYLKLISLAQCLRLVVPIWCQYIKDIADTVGNMRKEMIALKLLDKTNLIYSEPYERFVTFIEATDSTVDTNNTYLVVTSIGTEEQLEISKAKKIVRRVSLANASRPDTLISAVFNEIINQPSDDRRSSQKIKDKKLTGRDTDEDPSVIEQYKIKESLPKGEIRLIGHYLKGLTFLQSIDSTITQKELKRLKEISKELFISGWEPEPHNLNLAMFMVKGIPAESVEIIDTEYQILTCVAVYGLMLHWGYHDVAFMALARRVQTDDDDVMFVGNVNRAQIPAEIDAQLDKIWPYRRPAAPKINVAKQSISEYFKTIAGGAYTGSYAQADAVHFEDKLNQDKYYTPSRNMVIDLAKVLIEIHG